MIVLKSGKTNRKGSCDSSKKLNDFIPLRAPQREVEVQGTSTGGQVPRYLPTFATFCNAPTNLRLRTGISASQPDAIWWHWRFFIQTLELFPSTTACLPVALPNTKPNTPT